GSYRRSLTLPSGATPDDVKATYVDGILEVRVPMRREQPTEQKIEVTRV
ncbi:MAG: Hsp20 family protein, partial [Actinomycetes bacterium]